LSRQFGNRDIVVAPQHEHYPSLSWIDLVDFMFFQHPGEYPAGQLMDFSY
jgi:hypothetical protein